MGRSRYIITDSAQPHFLTCTVMEWLPLFSRPALVDILLDCWRYQQTRQGLRLYGYVVMENHLHYLAQAPDLARCVSSFKSYTARRILDGLQRRGAESVLQRLSFSEVAWTSTVENRFASFPPYTGRNSGRRPLTCTQAPVQRTGCGWRRVDNGAALSTGRGHGQHHRFTEEPCLTTAAPACRGRPTSSR